MHRLDLANGNRVSNGAAKRVVSWTRACKTNKCCVSIYSTIKDGPSGHNMCLGDV